MLYYGFNIIILCVFILFMLLLLFMLFLDLGEKIFLGVILCSFFKLKFLCKFVVVLI